MTSKTEKLDKQHVHVSDGAPDPTIQTQDGEGVLSGHSQQPDQTPEDLGGQAERSIKKSTVAERHITSEPGLKTAERRHEYIKAAKRQGEEVFNRK